MSYRALLFCPDEKTARTVTQVLGELEFAVEACLEPFAAVKKLMGEHFDAIVVDSSFIDEFAIYSLYAAQGRKKQTFLIGNDVVDLYQR